MTKPNIGGHAAPEVTNRMTFAQAYAHVLEQPTATYQTTGNRKSFIAKATRAAKAKGDHKGKKVIRFFQGGKEYARAYDCCWGFTTNCIGTYIDCYTAAIC